MFNRVIIVIFLTLILVGCENEVGKLEDKVSGFSDEIENMKNENISSLDGLINKSDNLARKGEKIKNKIDSIKNNNEELRKKISKKELSKKMKKLIESVENIKKKVIKDVASGIYENQLDERLLIKPNGVCRYADDDPEDECRWSIEGQARGGGVVIEMSRYAGPVNVHIGDVQAVLEDGELRIGRGVYKKIRDI